MLAASRSMARGSLAPALVATAAGAWLVAIAADLSGEGAFLHHHALIEDGPPLWVAVPVFLLAWQVMVAAMMVPASAPAISGFAAAARGFASPGRATAAFVAAFALAWAVFGLLAFSGDVVLHRTVDVTPWLADRRWLIQAAVVGLVGAYQFAPLKRRCLEACRHVAVLPHPTPGSAERVGFVAGLGHAIDCLGASGALMLLMFAAGFANLWWMAALTGLMIYEARGVQGRAAASAAGVALLALAAGSIVLGGLPAWGAA